MVTLSSKNRGPVGWLSKHQERMSLSFYEAKICTTNATSKKVVDFRNLSCSVFDAGYTHSDIKAPTVLNNDNDVCVKWSYNMTSKSARHIELCKNSVCKWVQTTLSTSSMCPGSSILPTSSLRKCTMAHTSGNSGTLSCPVSLNF